MLDALRRAVAIHPTYRALGVLASSTWAAGDASSYVRHCWLGCLSLMTPRLASQCLLDCPHMHAEALRKCVVAQRVFDVLP